MTPDLPTRWRERAALFRDHASEDVARAYETAADELEQVREDWENEPSKPDLAVSDGPEPTWTWRERLWVAPAETRIGTHELAEALGRPKSWIYARTQAGAEDPLPHSKFDGTLVFMVGEVRAWIREREEPVIGGPTHSTEWEKKGLQVL